MENEELMKIKNPQHACGKGPCAIVFNNRSWPIVAMHWGKDPVLGIRWTEPAVIDFPVGEYGHKRWFVIPEALAEAILNELQRKSNISEGQCKVVKEFLNKESANYGNCDVLQQALAS